MIEDVRGQIQKGANVVALLNQGENNVRELHLHHDLSKNELDTVLAGGRLNQE